MFRAAEYLFSSLQLRQGYCGNTLLSILLNHLYIQSYFNILTLLFVAEKSSFQSPYGSTMDNGMVSALLSLRSVSFTRETRVPNNRREREREETRDFFTLCLNSSNLNTRRDYVRNRSAIIIAVVEANLSEKKLLSFLLPPTPRPPRQLPRYNPKTLVRVIFLGSGSHRV